MTLEDIVDFFGSEQKTREKLGVSYTAFRAWHRAGRVPASVQCRVHVLSEGKLSVCTNTQPKIRNPVTYEDKEHGICEVKYICFTKEGYPVVRYIVPGGQKRSRDLSRLNIKGFTALIGSKNAR